MSSTDNISFYEVDLVCNLVSSIGCGSRSKPILVELENESIIKQAKLNRKGNIIGILWHKNIDVNSRLKIINTIFLRNELSTKQSNSNLCRDNLASFLNEESSWLDIENIDELSREEAKVVANQLTLIYEKKGVLNAGQKSKLKVDIENLFYSFFLNFDTINQLSDTKVYRKLVLQVIEVSKDYIDSNDIPEVGFLLNAIDGHYESDDKTKCCSTNK
jgi:hypothetical protein